MTAYVTLMCDGCKTRLPEVAAEKSSEVRVAAGTRLGWVAGGASEDFCRGCRGRVKQTSEWDVLLALAAGDSWSVRVVNAVIRAGLISTEALRAAGDDDLLAVRGLGVKGVHRLRLMLEQLQSE